MKFLKIISIILISLFVLIAVLAGGGYLLLRASLPERNGQVTVPGTARQIDIFFDDKGIPQVWAETETDAWYAVGWLHGEDRLFQMELTRRIASGRLSEIIGDITLSIDRRQRQVGHRQMAVRDVANLAEPYRGYLLAYVNGINAAVENSRALPFEFYLLGIDYEPWTLEDCLTIFSFQTWFSNDLQNNHEIQIEAIKKFGAQKAAELFGNYPPDAPLTVPETGTILVQNNWRDQFGQSLFAANQLPFGLTRASNAWTVAPKKSLSGQAILANDPHLELSRLPQFWYVLGVHTRDGRLNTLGITSPGLPFVTMGHNGKAAWAFTAGGVDVMDTYAERINPQNPGEYRIGDGYEPFTLRTEYIAVSGWDHPDTLQVKSTRHGPVIAADSNQTEVYALHWAGFDFSTAEAIPHLFRMAHVSRFQEFRQSVTRFAALDANWIYADINGNIGYQLGTPLPRRAHDSAGGYLPGWSGEAEWLGYRDLDDTPYAFNPEQGWLATCNNKPGAGEIAGNFDDTRIRRISELLASQHKFGARDMAQFQMDTKSAVWRPWRKEVVRLLKAIKEVEWAARIDVWDGSSGTASGETALLETWMVLLKNNALADDLGDSLRPYMNRILFRDRDFERLYYNGDATWFDDQSTAQIKESREDMAVRAMTEAVRLVGKQNWGEMQQITMAHPLSAVPLLSSLLDLKRGPFPRGGTNGSLNNSTAFWDGEGKFKSVAGPSWRLIIDFKDIDRLRVVIPSGQSGHPLSPHFFDFYDLWESGAYWTLPFSEETVKQKSVSQVVLVPEG